MSLSEVLDASQPAPGIRCNGSVSGATLVATNAYVVSADSVGDQTTLFTGNQSGLVADCRVSELYYAVPTWSPLFGYYEGAVVVYGSPPQLFQLLVASAPAGVPPQDGATWKLLSGLTGVNASPMASAVTTLLRQEADVNGNLFTFVGGTNAPQGFSAQGLTVQQSVGGYKVVQSPGAFYWTDENTTAPAGTYQPIAEGCKATWNTVGEPATYAAACEFINASGLPGNTNAAGFTFYEGEDGAAKTALTQCFRIGKTTIGLLKVGVANTGLFQAEGLQIVPSLLDPSIGTGTIGAGGTVTITTGASDPASRIFVSYTEGTARTAPLTVSAKTANDFTVLGDANATFDWWVVNPNYS